jgi:hypothetical protein
MAKATKPAIKNTGKPAARKGGSAKTRRTVKTPART